jgi:hypothetical protein
MRLQNVNSHRFISQGELSQRTKQSIPPAVRVVAPTPAPAATAQELDEQHAGLAGSAIGLGAGAVPAIALGAIFLGGTGGFLFLGGALVALGIAMLIGMIVYAVLAGINANASPRRADP